MIEFALIAPLLLLVIFAIIEMGWIGFSYSQINNAMREAGRFASVVGFGAISQSKDCAGIRKRLVDMAGWTGIRATDIQIYYDDGRPIELAGDTAKVGDCPNSGSFTFNTLYRDINGNARASADLKNDDRVVIWFDKYTLRFITPFFRTFAPNNGITITLKAARSIFPSGETTISS